MNLPAGITATSDVYAEIEKRDELIAKLSGELAACRAREAVTEGATQRYADRLLLTADDTRRMDWLDKIGANAWTLNLHPGKERQSFRATVDDFMAATENPNV